MEFKEKLLLIPLFFIPLPLQLHGQELPEFHCTLLEILKSDNYSNNQVPPTKAGESSSVKVYVNLGLREIQSLDDKKMELQTQIALRQTWTDARLAYNSQHKEGFVTLPLDIEHKPWIPDTFISNEKQSTVHGMTRPNSFFRVYPNGTILQSTRISVILSCFMHLENFPFDRQACEIILESFSHPASVLEYAWEPFVDLLKKRDSKHLTQFQLLKYETGKRKVNSKVTGHYSTIFAALIFQRKLGYYIIQFFAPTALSAALSWISFWLGEAVEARLSLAVTVLLTMTTQINGIHQTLPQVSYLTALSIFSGVCILFGVLAIFQSAVVFTLLKTRYRYSIPNSVIGKVMGIEGPNAGVKMIDSVKENEAILVMNLAQQLDNVSKRLFPLLFTLFLVVYFGYFLGA